MSLSRFLAGALLLMPLLAQSMPIDKRLVIRPIQICNSTGSCANDQQQLFEPVDDAVWAQAGIEIQYLQFSSVVDQRSFDLTHEELFGSFAQPENWFETAPGNVDNTHVVDLWFARSLPAGILGIADADADPTGMFIDVVRNNILVSQSVVEFSGNDTIAHEIGHVLGLNHCGYRPSLFGSSYIPCPGASVLTDDSKNLMTPFVTFNVSPNNVAPHGLGLAELTAEQIRMARLSPFLIDVTTVPLPAPWSMLLLGACMAWVRSRSR